jgi:tol-pal system protein YbgF
MRRTSLKILVAVAAAVALSNCYGAKMVKGPINSEHAALAADTIRAEQRRLIEKIETLERKLAQESEERTSSQAQISVTLGELEEAVRVLTSRMEDNEQMMNRGGRGPSGGSRSAGASATRDTVDAADQLYRAAYLDVTRGNYELAAQAFGDYLTRFPQGPRVAESHYYLGECNYATERYLEAAGEFQRVVREFPASRLVPASYLKMGRAYTQLEERGLAEKAFRTLIEKHPTSEEAKQAQAALQELGG